MAAERAMLWAQELLTPNEEKAQLDAALHLAIDFRTMASVGGYELERPWRNDA
jgi:hypothetical protein